MGSRACIAVPACLVLAVPLVALAEVEEYAGPNFFITVGDDRWELNGTIVVGGGQTFIMGLTDGVGEEGPVTIVIAGCPGVNFTSTYGSELTQIMIGGMLYVANKNTIEQGTELIVTFAEIEDSWYGTFRGTAIYAQPGMLTPGLMEFEGVFDIPEESVTYY